jgi:hypothetical protein
MSYLYKFRPMPNDESKEYTGRSITHQELYFSNASAFNDPFDCLPVISLDATKKEFETYLAGFFERQYPGISRRDKIASVKAISKDPERNHKSKAVIDMLSNGLKQAMDLAGVLCLSENPMSVLMWSHYTGCHKGICLKFKLCDEKGFFTEAHSVDYQSKRPVLNLIKGDHEKQGRDALLTKADFWSYEKESRMVNPRRPPGVHKYPAELLEGVILGANINSDDKELVKQWILTLSHKVDLFQATINSTNYSIDIKKI